MPAAAKVGMNRTSNKCPRPKLRRGGNEQLINITLLPECVGRGAKLPGPRRSQTRPCGECTESCVFMAIEMCLILGIIANIIVIIRVIKDRKLRSNTFVGIACLALADSVFLALNLTFTYELVIRTLMCTLPRQLKGTAFAYFKGVAWFGANGHVALMAIIRYIILVYPIKSQAFLTIKKVLFLSMGVWLLGFLVRGIFTLIVKLTGEKPRESVAIYLSLWIITYLLPLVVMTTLHIIKIQKVKKTSYHSENALVRKSIARMSKMIIVIIICAAVLPLSLLVFGTLDAIEEIQYPSRNFKSIFRSIAHLLFLLNNCVNPFIYAFMSKPFRNSILRMVGKEVSEGGDSSTGTASTPITRRRGTQESVLEDGNQSKASIATPDIITMETLKARGIENQSEDSQTHKPDHRL